jgi:hypothetical protein
MKSSLKIKEYKFDFPMKGLVLQHWHREHKWVLGFAAMNKTHG